MASTHTPTSLTDLQSHKPRPEVMKKWSRRFPRATSATLAFSLLWIPDHLCQGTLTAKPSEYDRQYYPTVEDVRNMSRKLTNNIYQKTCLTRMLMKVRRLKGSRSWLEESLSMLLLVGVPVPCRRGLLSWGCIILDTTIVCFPSGRPNVAASVT